MGLGGLELGVEEGLVGGERGGEMRGEDVLGGEEMGSNIGINMLEPSVSLLRLSTNYRGVIEHFWF